MSSPYIQNFSVGSSAAWGKQTRTKTISWVSPSSRTSCVSSTSRWMTTTQRFSSRWRRPQSFSMVPKYQNQLEWIDWNVNLKESIIQSSSLFNIKFRLNVKCGPTFILYFHHTAMRQLKIWIPGWRGDWTLLWPVDPSGGNRRDLRRVR